MFQYSWDKTQRAYAILYKGAIIGYAWQFNGAWFAHPTLHHVTNALPLKAVDRDTAAARLYQERRRAA